MEFKLFLEAKESTSIKYGNTNHLTAALFYAVFYNQKLETEEDVDKKYAMLKNKVNTILKSFKNKIELIEKILKKQEKDENVIQFIKSILNDSKLYTGRANIKDFVGKIISSNQTFSPKEWTSENMEDSFGKYKTKESSFAKEDQIEINREEIERITKEYVDELLKSPLFYKQYIDKMLSSPEEYEEIKSQIKKELSEIYKEILIQQIQKEMMSRRSTSHEFESEDEEGESDFSDAVDRLDKRGMDEEAIKKLKEDEKGFYDAVEDLQKGEDGEAEEYDSEEEEKEDGIEGAEEEAKSKKTAKRATKKTKKDKKQEQENISNIKKIQDFWSVPFQVEFYSKPLVKIFRNEAIQQLVSKISNQIFKYVLRNTHGILNNLNVVLDEIQDPGQEELSPKDEIKRLFKLKSPMEKIAITAHDRTQLEEKLKNIEQLINNPEFRIKILNSAKDEINKFQRKDVINIPSQYAKIEEMFRTMPILAAMQSIKESLRRYRIDIYEKNNNIGFSKMNESSRQSVEEILKLEGRYIIAYTCNVILTNFIKKQKEDLINKIEKTKQKSLTTISQAGDSFKIKSKQTPKEKQEERVRFAEEQKGFKNEMIEKIISLLKSFGIPLNEKQQSSIANEISSKWVEMGDLISEDLQTIIDNDLKKYPDEEEFKKNLEEDIENKLDELYKKIINHVSFYVKTNRLLINSLREKSQQIMDQEIDGESITKKINEIISQKIEVYLKQLQKINQELSDESSEISSSAQDVSQKFTKKFDVAKSKCSNCGKEDRFGRFQALMKPNGDFAYDSNGNKKKICPTCSNKLKEKTSNIISCVNCGKKYDFEKRGYIKDGIREKTVCPSCYEKTPRPMRIDKKSSSFSEWLKNN